jgi:glutathione synthase/RimK-type ligase-like ATP-grasp enzyme
MLLIITNSKDATADYLTEVLHRSGIAFVRFDTDKSLEGAVLEYAANTPRLALGGALYTPDLFDHVWYRRPERLKLPQAADAPESKFLADEWSEALEGYFAHIPQAKWMNHPAYEAGAAHKLEQLSRAKGLGFRVPATLVTQNPDEARRFYRLHGGWLVVKPLARGHVEKGGPGLDTVIFTNRVRAEDLEDCDELARCPTLFQEEIHKRLDVRITVVDSDIHAVGLSAPDSDGRQRCDIRRNNMDDVAYTPLALPTSVEGCIRSLMQSYNLRFSAIDMAVTEDGQWVFFEINPNGQWAWTDLEGVTNIAASFAKSFNRRPSSD